MKRYKVVESDKYGELRISEDGRTVDPNQPNRHVRSDSNYHKEAMKLYEKDEYRIVEEKDWEDYGAVANLTKEERSELKQKLKVKLSNQQQKFVEQYILGEFSGNLARSYLKAYGHTEEEYGLANASNSASNLFQRSYIRKYSQILLFDAGFNVDAVDNELHQLIYQQDDKRIKLEAIKEWNRLHKRISKYVNVTGDVNHTHQQKDIDYSKLSDKELDTLLTLMKKAKADRDNEVKVVDE